jgi:hypothetical protein
VNKGSALRLNRRFPQSNCALSKIKIFGTADFVEMRELFNTLCGDFTEAEFVAECLRLVEDGRRRGLA